MVQKKSQCVESNPKGLLFVGSRYVFCKEDRPDNSVYHSSGLESSNNYVLRTSILTAAVTAECAIS